MGSNVRPIDVQSFSPERVAAFKAAAVRFIHDVCTGKEESEVERLVKHGTLTVEEDVSGFEKLQATFDHDEIVRFFCHSAVNGMVDESLFHPQGMTLCLGDFYPLEKFRRFFEVAPLSSEAITEETVSEVQAPDITDKKAEEGSSDALILAHDKKPAQVQGLQDKHESDVKAAEKGESQLSDSSAVEEDEEEEPGAQVLAEDEEPALMYGLVGSHEGDFKAEEEDGSAQPSDVGSSRMMDGGVADGAAAPLTPGDLVVFTDIPKGFTTKKTTSAGTYVHGGFVQRTQDKVPTEVLHLFPLRAVQGALETVKYGAHEGETDEDMCRRAAGILKSSKKNRMEIPNGAVV
jgi:hypothetical protein